MIYYASEETNANILCYADVEDLYYITYVPRIAFIVHLPNRDITFVRKEKMYVANWDEGLVCSTVQENAAVYTKVEVKRAKEAHTFLRTSGYPSLEDAAHLLEDGNVENVPGLTRSDIEGVYKV